MNAATQPAIRLTGVSRTYGPVRALHEVTLDIMPGSVHGLVGENGAGKSTLMKLLAGLEHPTHGNIDILGQRIDARHWNPQRALATGVAMIHQELNLVEELSIADNLFLGRENATLGWVRQTQTRQAAQTWLNILDFQLDPATKVKGLSVAQKQMVEIAKAVSCQAKVLILDEPTAVLTAHETARLFALIRELRHAGVTLIYISHHLQEVIELCDRVTVLRDGEVVTTLERTDIAGADKPLLPPGEGAFAGKQFANLIPQTPSPLPSPGGRGGASSHKNRFNDSVAPNHAGQTQLANLMVGRTLGDYFPPRGKPGERVMLEVKGLKLTQPAGEQGIDLTVHEGEIVGLAGLVGAGRTELGETLIGLRCAAGGQVRIDGQQVVIRTPAQAMQHGLVYVSEDRRGAGLILEMSIAGNITLAALRHMGSMIDRQRESATAQKHVDRLGIRISRLSAKVATLSGGNQQKVALAKWLEVKPKVLILDEPTRGVDIGAKKEIYQLIVKLTQQGLACLLISSEMNELLGLCHRIAVMRRGEVVTMLEADAAGEETMLHHAAGIAR